MFDKHKVENIICETKKTGDVSYKVNFINRMIHKGYHVYSYEEDYRGKASGFKSIFLAFVFIRGLGQPMEWIERLGRPLDTSRLRPLSQVNEVDWIPYEDLIYSLHDLL